MKIRKVIYNVFFFIVLFYSIWLILFKLAVDFSTIKIIWAAPVMGAVALLFSALRGHDVMLETSDNKLGEISKDVKMGVLKTKFKELILVLIASFAVFPILYKFVNHAAACCFIIGGLGAFAASFFTFLIAANSNLKTLNASSISPYETHKTVLNGGFSAFLIPLAISLILLPVLYYTHKDPNILAGFAYGWALSAFITTAFGEIFSKAFNIISSSKKDGESGLCLSLAFETGNFALNIASVMTLLLVSAIILGALVLNLIGAFIPLTLAAAGVFCIILSSVFGKIKFVKSNKISLLLVSLASVILYGIISYYLIETVFLPGYGLFYPILTGVVTAVIIALSGYFSTRCKKDKLTGFEKEEALARSVSSSFLPLALSGVSALIAFITAGGMESYTAGFWGVALAGVTFLSATGVMGAFIGYKTSSEFALNVVKDEIEKDELSKISKAGKVFSGISKNIFSVASICAGLCVLAAVAMSINVEDMDLLNPFVMLSIAFGASIPYLSSGLVNGSFIKVAKKVLKNETTGASKDIGAVSNKALFGALIPTILTVSIPLIVYLGITNLFEKTLGIQSLGGALMGAVIAGGIVSIMSANRDSLSDNSGDLTMKESSYLMSSAAYKLVAAVVLILIIVLLPA